MKNRLLVFHALLIIFTNVSFAQQSGFGLGVMLGEPTGISTKGWVSGSNAIDGGIAWSFTKKASFHIHADYLMHLYNLINVPKGKLPFYFGIGARVKFSDKTKVGIRIPLGLDYQFAGAPIDIFLELVPILELVPKTEFSFNAALGARFFFD